MRIFNFQFSIFNLVVLFCLSACDSKTEPKQDDIDMVAVAKDTAMQVIIDNSFEYVKDHSFENRRFTVITGGYTNFKDVMVAESKGSINSDTLYYLKTDSAERITGSFVSDLDANHSPEIHLLIRNKNTKKVADRVIALVNNKWREIPIVDDREVVARESSNDEWFVNGNLLVRKYPNYDKGLDTAKGTTWLYYKLKNNIFTLEKSEAVL